MKTIILLIHFILVPFIFAPLAAQGADLEPAPVIEIQDAVVYPFFRALKNGDVDAFKNYFSMDMYDKNRILLEENTAYPEFLRNYYQGADISVLKASDVAGEVEFDVLIEFPNGSQGISKLIVSEAMGGEGTMPDKKGWKISSMESIR